MPKIQITSNKGIEQLPGSTIPLHLNSQDTVEKVAIVSNSSAFVRNARSNAEWPQPANTIITNISLLCTVAPVTTAGMDLGYVVGTGSAGAQIATAVTDEIIDAAADGTDLAVGGLKLDIALARKTTSATSLAADPTYTTSSRTIYLGTTATDAAITTAGTILWIVRYICFE